MLFGYPYLAAYKMPIADDVNFVVNAGPYIGIGLGGKVKYDDLKSDYLEMMVPNVLIWDFNMVSVLNLATTFC